MLLGILLIIFFILCLFLSLVFIRKINMYPKITIGVLFVILGGVAIVTIGFLKYEWWVIDLEWPVFVIFLAVNVEFLLTTFMCVYEKIWIGKKQRDAGIQTDTDETLPLHAFLICAHNSSGNIKGVIQSIGKFVKTRDIYIADNGSTPEEQVKTLELCNDTGANCINIERGNKTIAQLIGCYKILQKGYKFVTICDDDLIFDEWNLQNILCIFNDKVKCVSYTVLPLKEKNSILNKFQRAEYVISSYTRKIQGEMSSCFFSSGAIATWDLEIITEVLLRHNADFKGDDMRCGMILHSLYGKNFISSTKKHSVKYEIKVSDTIIYTKVPSCRFHTKKCKCGEPSLYHQRVNSWETSRYSFITEYTKGIFTTKDWGTKVSYVLAILTILIDFFVIAMIGFGIMFLVKDTFGFFVMFWQILAINTILMSVCWAIVIRRYNVIKLKWVLLMPVFYYLPNIFLVKIPSMFAATLYVVTKKRNPELYKRTEDWVHYIKPAIDPRENNV